MTTGVSALDSRVFLRMSNPVPSGILRSVRTRSGEVSSTSRSPSEQVPAVRTAYPSFSRTIESIPVIPGSSSTMRTRGPGGRDASPVTRTAP